MPAVPRVAGHTGVHALPVSQRTTFFATLVPPRGSLAAVQISSSTATYLDWPVTKNLSRQLLVLDDYSGHYAGGIHQEATGCFNSAFNGTRESIGIVNITQNGAAITLQSFPSTGGTSGADRLCSDGDFLFGRLLGNRFRGSRRGLGLAACRWTTKTLTFVAASNSTTINFVSDVSLSGGTLNAGAALDNVRITQIAAAPVPLDWAQWAAAMLLFFAGGLWIRRHRVGTAR